MKFYRIDPQLAARHAIAVVNKETQLSGNIFMPTREAAVGKYFPGESDSGTLPRTAANILPRKIRFHSK